MDRDFLCKFLTEAHTIVDLQHRSPSIHLRFTPFLLPYIAGYPRLRNDLWGYLVYVTPKLLKYNVQANQLFVIYNGFHNSLQIPLNTDFPSGSVILP